MFYHKVLLNSALFKVARFGNRKRRADSYVRCDWLADDTKALRSSYGVLRFVFHHEGFADEAENQRKTVSGTYAYVDWWHDLDSEKSYQQLRKERTLRRVRPVTQREATQYANSTNPHHYLVQHVVPIHQIHPSNITFFPSSLKRTSTEYFVLEKRRKFLPFSFQQEVAEKQFELWQNDEYY